MSKSVTLAECSVTREDIKLLKVKSKKEKDQVRVQLCDRALAGDMERFVKQHWAARRNAQRQGNKPGVKRHADIIKVMLVALRLLK